jgi:hypothetical protein
MLPTDPQELDLYLAKLRADEARWAADPKHIVRDDEAPDFGSWGTDYKHGVNPYDAPVPGAGPAGPHAPAFALKSPPGGPATKPDPKYIDTEPLPNLTLPPSGPHGPEAPPGLAPGGPAPPPEGVDPGPEPHGPGGGGGGSYSSMSYKGSLGDYGKSQTQIDLEHATADHARTVGGYDKAAAAYGAQAEEEKAALFKQHYDEVARQQAKAEAEEANRQKWTESALLAHHREVEKIQKMQVDPDHWWAKKSTGEKITAGIGMAFIAFGAGLSASGGGDATIGMKALQHEIDNDIAAQKMNIDNAWQGADRKQNIYQSAFAAFKDERMATASAKASAWELVGMKLKSIEQSTTSKVAKQQAGKIGEQIDFSIQKYQAEVQMLGEQNYAAMMARRAQAMAAAAAEEARDLKERNKFLMGVDKELITQNGLPPGSSGYTLAPSHAVDKNGKMLPGPDGRPMRNPHAGRMVTWTNGEWALPGAGVAHKGKGEEDYTVGVPGGGEVVARSRESQTHLGKIYSTGTNYGRALLGLRDAIGRGVSVKGYMDEGHKKGLVSTTFGKYHDLGAHDKGIENLLDKILPGYAMGKVAKDAAIAEVDNMIDELDESRAEATQIYARGTFPDSGKVRSKMPDIRPVEKK